MGGSDHVRVSAVHIALRRELWGGRSVSLLPMRLLKAMLVRRTPRRCLATLRAAELVEARGHPRLGWWFRGRIERVFGCYFDPGAIIGPGLKVPHPIGVVVGAGVVMGRDCTLFQQVTLGGARFGDSAAGAHPRLGDGVAVFAGAKVLGQLSVGDRAVIGANAVVTRDVPAGYVAVGVPARTRPRRLTGGGESGEA